MIVTFGRDETATTTPSGVVLYIEYEALASSLQTRVASRGNPWYYQHSPNRQAWIAEATQWVTTFGRERMPLLLSPMGYILLLDRVGRTE